MPIVCGHEFSGHVVELGPDVEGVETGTLVSVPPLIPCRVCAHCVRGDFGLCESYDYFGSRSDGAYAEYVVVPVGNLLTMPEGLDPRAAAMLDPAAIALHALWKTGLRTGHRVLVVGAGPDRAVRDPVGPPRGRRRDRQPRPERGEGGDGARGRGHGRGAVRRRGPRARRRRLRRRAGVRGERRRGRPGRRARRREGARRVRRHPARPGRAGQGDLEPVHAAGGDAARRLELVLARRSPATSGGRRRPRWRPASCAGSS